MSLKPVLLFNLTYMASFCDIDKKKSRPKSWILNLTLRAALFRLQ